MGRRGFSLIEMFVVFVVVGVIVMIGAPRLRDAFEKTNVRSARIAVATSAAIARAAAVQRGCRAALHFAYGTSSGMWVTACRLATPNSVDTIRAGSAWKRRTRWCASPATRRATATR